ncbi:MAG: carbohydrate kinase family protein [Ruminococcus sp.]
MSKIAVCGLVNMETTASVDSFPIDYRPIDYRFFGVTSNPSGVGFNVSLALNALGDEVRLCSLCGDDSSARLIKSELEAEGVSTKYILSKNKSTAQSVVLYDQTGRRYVICDLADNQDLDYEKDVFSEALKDIDLVCLCNINYAANLIDEAKSANVPIATDVHCLSDIHDEYNARFMRAADIVFLSNEAIIGREEDFSKELMQEYGCKAVVVGMGDRGALLRECTDEAPVLVPAVYTRPVRNTVGAGDSLYSAFIHFYTKDFDALSALQKAVYFASYKIGENGGAKGFLSEEKLLEIINEG